jgi:hypothetical protein
VAIVEERKIEDPDYRVLGGEFRFDQDGNGVSLRSHEQGKLTGKQQLLPS